ncbi:MAG: helicase [Candidatus Hydrogenedentes bacterium]|nr:helicase [Candidatus Hydrogenedentota bacterium]
MADIIDNVNVTLLDAVRQALRFSVSADWAVGYTYFSGLAPLVEDLGRLRRLRLLLGNGTDRETLEQLIEQHHDLDLAARQDRKRRYRNVTEQRQLARETAERIAEILARAEQNDPAESALKQLRELAASGRLEARMYGLGRLHAKAYVFDYAEDGRFERGMGIVGSSNLTLGGLSGNTELNVAVHGNDNHAQLKAWFESLWQQAVPLQEELREELDRSWALYPATPWDVYMKVLLTLVRDRLDDEGGGRDLLLEDTVLEQLTEFQKDAVERGIQIIREHGGVFIADVVGLGKSYIGAAIARHFRRAEGRRVLILCPAPLVDMWTEYAHQFDLNARVLSTGQLRGAAGILEDPRYAECDFILLDESHHFRYPNTQQYEELEAFIHKRRPLLCMLTATPQNKSPWDVYYQLRLFQGEQEISLPILPADLRAYFRQVENGQKSLPALLKMVLVRRTRRHILRWYGIADDTGQRLRDLDDAQAAPYLRGERHAFVMVSGRRQGFPRRRLSTLSYNIDATYAGFYDRLRALINGDQDVDGHAMTYARFGLGLYLKESFQKKKVYEDLRRGGRNMRGLIRILLFKRLESSVQAFRESVRRMLEANRQFLDGLDRGVVLAREAGLDARQFYEMDTAGELDWEGLRQKSPYKIEAFDLPRLREDVASDIAVLEEIHRMVDPIIPARDAKLHRFLEGMRNNFPKTSGKVLVFTQFADTATYLFNALNSDGHRPDVAMVTGQSANQARIAARFAPKANAKTTLARDRDQEINILVATDVMSEGLNLQDCDVIVNYDLHWNPVRLIQRFGRIDRIGSENDEIWGFNFLPEAGIERNLGLTEKLRRRISEIHQVIGLDTQILEETEALNEDALYAIYDERSEVLADAEEGDETIMDLVEAEEFFRRMRQEDPEEYQRICELRDGIRCGRVGRGPHALALCASDGFQQFYSCDGGEVQPVDIETALSWLRCAPDTPRESLPRQHNTRVMEILRRFREDAELRRNQQNRLQRLRPGQRYVLKRLGDFAAQTNDPELRRFADTLYEAFIKPLPAALHRQLNGFRRHNQSDEDFMKALKLLYFEYGLDRMQAPGEAGQNQPEDAPRVIASEAFIEPEP